MLAKMFAVVNAFETKTFPVTSKVLAETPGPTSISPVVLKVVVVRVAALMVVANTLGVVTILETHALPVMAKFAPAVG